MQSSVVCVLHCSACVGCPCHVLKLGPSCVCIVSALCIAAPSAVKNTNTNLGLHTHDAGPSFNTWHVHTCLHTCTRALSHAPCGRLQHDAHTVLVARPTCCMPCHVGSVSAALHLDSLSALPGDAVQSSIDQQVSGHACACDA